MKNNRKTWNFIKNLGTCGHKEYQQPEGSGKNMTATSDIVHAKPRNAEAIFWQYGRRERVCKTVFMPKNIA